ncbi:MAG: TraM recognition domain-containing protein, partial [Nitrosopumilaceae archaeon]
IAGLKSDSWEPLLNRIEPFATDSYLRKVFGVRRSTIDFVEMLKPGRQTFIRISDTETPHYATGLAIMGIVIGIWFSLQERAARTLQSSPNRNLVVLCLDEFQRVQSLSILGTMLEQARSYNLGLVLSHQNLRQIDEVLLGATAGNTATQIYGRVAGQDASKIARNIDPKFSTELTDQIATQPDFQFTIKTRAPIGEEQGTPQQFRAFQPPELNMSEEQAADYNEIMRTRYGRKEDEEIRSIFEGQDESTKWMLQLEDPSAFPPQEEWRIIIALKEAPLNLSEVVEKTGSSERDATSKILDKMLAREIVRISSVEKKGAVTMKVYDITDKARSRYFPVSFDAMGRGAQDIQDVAQKAFDYHATKGDYIAVASQDMQEGRDRTDMVSYKYASKSPVSIEIESEGEVNSHPEQVAYNMKKWRLLGFQRCEVWTRSRVVEKIYERLDPELKKDVDINISG